MRDEAQPSSSSIPGGDLPAWQLPRCPECGYELEMLPPRGACPECGTAYDRADVIVVGCARGATADIHNASPRKIGWYLISPACILAFQWLTPGNSPVTRLYWTAVLLPPIALALVLRFFVPRDHTIRLRLDDAGLTWHDLIFDHPVYARWAQVDRAIGLLVILGVLLGLLAVAIYAIYESGFTLGTVLGLVGCLALDYWIYRVTVGWAAKSGIVRRNTGITYLPWADVGRVRINRENEAVYRLRVSRRDGLFGPSFQLEFPCTELRAKQIEAFAAARIPAPPDASISHVWTHTTAPDEEEQVDF